jgi:hypothetical protein
MAFYIDANLYYNITTGRTGMTIDWNSKSQSTVETATYESEFVAARIAVDQVIDLRTTLQY